METSRSSAADSWLAAPAMASISSAWTTPTRAAKLGFRHGSRGNTPQLSSRDRGLLGNRAASAYSFEVLALRTMDSRGGTLIRSDKVWVAEASNLAPERDGWQVSYSDDGFGGPNPQPFERLTWKNFYNAPGCEFHSAAEKTRHGKGNNCLFYDSHVELVVESAGRNWRVEH